MSQACRARLCRSPPNPLRLGGRALLCEPAELMLLSWLLPASVWASALGGTHTALHAHASASSRRVPVTCDVWFVSVH